MMSGLYCQECSQQLEESDESPLFSTCETVLGAWCPVLYYLMQNRYCCSGESRRRNWKTIRGPEYTTAEEMLRRG